MKIDIHTHILPSSWPEMEGVELRLRQTGESDGSAIMEWKDGTFFRKVKRNCFDGAKIVEECDIAGVDVQVLCTVPVMFNYHLKPEVARPWARYLNDDLARTVSQFPRRFVGLGTLPMQDPAEAVKELRRCVTELGFRGFQIASHINAYDAERDCVKDLMLSDAAYLPLWEAAAELGVGFLVHPWDMKWCDKKYWLPWLVGMTAETCLAVCSVMLSGILDKVPNLKFMFSHSGGAFPATIGRIEWGYKTRPDLVAVDSKKSPREYMASKAIYLDSICHDPKQLEYLVDLCGADRIAMGSDYPFPLGEVPSVAPLTHEVIAAYPGEMVENASFLSAQSKQQILSGTAVDFLGLDPAAFDRHTPLTTVTREQAIRQNLDGVFDHAAATRPCGDAPPAVAAGGSVGTDTSEDAEAAEAAKRKLAGNGDGNDDGNANDAAISGRPHSPSAKRLRQR